MSYQSASLVDVLAAINAANSTTFTLNDLTFSAPTPVSGSWQSQTTARNTGINITAKPGVTFKGHTSIVYDRLDFAALTPVHFPGLTVTGFNADSAHDLIPMLTYWNGLHITTDDIEDTPLTDNGDGTRNVVITAKSGSYGWIGSVTMLVKAGGASLNQLVTNMNLNGLNYPTSSDQDTYAQLYMYPYDFTPYFDTLVMLNIGSIDSSSINALVTAFKAVDLSSGKALWNADAAQTAWSLAGATVMSNGLNSSSMPTNPAYKYVCAIKLRDDVQTPAGTLYLHYNDPFNPDA